MKKMGPHHKKMGPHHKNLFLIIKLGSHRPSYHPNHFMNKKSTSRVCWFCPTTFSSSSMSMNLICGSTNDQDDHKIMTRWSQDYDKMINMISMISMITSTFSALSLDLTPSDSWVCNFRESASYLNVHQCSPWTPMFTNVHQCSPMFILNIIHVVIRITCSRTR